MAIYELKHMARRIQEQEMGNRNTLVWGSQSTCEVVLDSKVNCAC